MKLFVNFLTTSRIPIILLVVLINLVVNAKESLAWFFTSVILMALVGITDFADGYLARKYKVTSKFGAHADPLTDKIFFLATFPMLIYLSSKNSSNLHTVFLVILALSYSIRDQIVTFYRTIGSEHKIDAKATWYGKLRTAISFPAIIFIYYQIEFPAVLLQSKVPDSLYAIMDCGIVPVFIVEAVLFFLTSATLVMYSVKYFPAVKAEIE